MNQIGTLLDLSLQLLAGALELLGVLAPLAHLNPDNFIQLVSLTGDLHYAPVGAQTLYPLLENPLHLFHILLRQILPGLTDAVIQRPQGMLHRPGTAVIQGVLKILGNGLELAVDIFGGEPDDGRVADQSGQTGAQFLVVLHLLRSDPVGIVLITDFAEDRGNIVTFLSVLGSLVLGGLLLLFFAENRSRGIHENI